MKAFLQEISRVLEFKRKRACLIKEDQHLLRTLRRIPANFDPSGWIAHIDIINEHVAAGWAKKLGTDKSQFLSLYLGETPLYECFLANKFRGCQARNGMARFLHFGLA